ncbi:hypothetical protein HDV01_007108 [Terramyces sp. JEL0728]|nr:hypothetical protein HDV01_007108 [Terramyces sp. JEL0728]
MLSTTEYKSLLKYLQTKPISNKYEQLKLKSTLAHLETVLHSTGDIQTINELKKKIPETKEKEIKKPSIEDLLQMTIEPERAELLKQVKFKGMKPTFNQKKSELLKEAIVLDKSEEELTEILAQQSKQLLNSTLRFNEKLKQDKEHLDSLDEKIQDTTTKVQSSRAGMKQITKSTWTTTIMIWISVLLAVLVMAWMLIYMRIVSPSKVVYVKETKTVQQITPDVKTAVQTTGVLEPTTTVNHNEL